MLCDNWTTENVFLENTYSAKLSVLRTVKIFRFLYAFHVPSGVYKALAKVYAALVRKHVDAQT